MSAIDEDGLFPAMPITAGNHVYAQGLTLRDWFAGQALSASQCRLHPDDEAVWAYKIADAMIAARKGGAA